MTRRWKTVGVAPPDTTEVYQDSGGNWMRDGGATWDANQKAWKTTKWKLTDQQYKVTYGDGKEIICKEKPEVYVETVEPIEPVEPKEGEESPEIPVNPIKEMKPKEPKVIKVEEVPACWELQNQYVSVSEKPEWDTYFTRELLYVEPIVAPLPQEREDGGDWLQQKVKRVRKVSELGTLR